MKTRLEEHYLTAVRPVLIEKFEYGMLQYDRGLAATNSRTQPLRSTHA